MKYTLFVLCLLLVIAGCTQELEKNTDTISIPSDFALYYTYGVGEKNILDTVNNLYVKDMICQENQEYTVILSNEEKQQIINVLEASSFFDLDAEYVQTEEIQTACQPDYSFTLTVTMDGKTHTIHRHECGVTRVSSITSVLNTIMEEKQNELGVEEPPCGYL